MSRELSRTLLLVTVALSVATFCACESCRTPHTETPTKPDAAAVAPTARLYLVSDLAGALEPCGCVKDQLGGMDHFGALVGGAAPKAATAVLSAGPLFFMDMELSGDKRAQEIAKAHTIAAAMKTLGLAAFAPGRNEWAGGPELLGALVKESGAAMLAANVTAKGVTPAKWIVKDVGGLKLGIVGVAAPEKSKVTLEGVTSTSPSDAVRAGVAALKAQGAQAIVALAAVGRGEAKRIADANPSLLAVLVGPTSDSGEANTDTPPAERVGDVLVVQTGNHLQTVGVLDLFLRPNGSREGALVRFADATGIERIRKRESLLRRVDELRTKIAIWEKDKTIQKRDLDARRADLAKLEAESAALESSAPPAKGSFYEYTRRDIRDDLGASDAVEKEMLAYYKEVNEHNRVAFADRKPKPAPKGQPGYVGVDVCTNCHEDPRAVWDGTEHAHAYATLADQFKQFNLDCVSCHVTGYDKPGGSTVTHVEGLKDVQCEVCHGPGSLHAATPDDVKIPVAKPGTEVCLSCHHPPHVHTFDAKAKMAEILGPGHGEPAK